MTQLTEAATKAKDADATSAKYARYAWVMQAMFDEVIDELADSEPDFDDKMATWFEQFGRVVEWCGSGDYSVLPDALRPYFQQQLALTAGKAE